MNIDISELAQAVAEHLIQDRLWGILDIAVYFNRTPKHTGSRIVCLPGFPGAIRLPVASGGHGDPLWEPNEVKDFARKYKS